MNRNNEAHFNQIPQTHISRSRFKRDQNIKFTFDAGKLIPFYVDEVLPGDTFAVDTAGIVRMTTPIFPVMDNAYLDVYYFFVPNRIVWEHWREFMGENTTRAWEQEIKYTVPKLYLSGRIRNSKGDSVTNKGTCPVENSILDYMGIPTKINKTSKIILTKADFYDVETAINALPIRGYCKIWNEWFRDQNLTDPVTEIRDDAVDTPSDIDANKNVYKHLNNNKNSFSETEMNESAVWGDNCLPVAKYHDYFTSALPKPQKGPEVTIPMSGLYPVELRTISGMTPQTTIYLNGTGSGAMSAKPTIDGGGGGAATINGASSDGGSTVKQGSLYVNLAGDATATGASATINELRQAFAVQHYYEALARGGSRYREIIRSMFGTLISDKTVQVPEYLGGGRYPINMSQVVQTSATTENSPQGNTGAISVTPFSESSFTKSFEEHGFVIGVCCVRHDHTYQQGIERFWSREDALDYYFPQFANLGEQGIKVKEIYNSQNQTKENDNETFGYQEAWAEYRMKPNRVAGKFRSNADGTLDTWHYADNYTERPYLSDEWIAEGKEEIQRTLAVQNEPQFIADFLIKNNTTRPMPLYSVPGLEKL